MDLTCSGASVTSSMTTSEGGAASKCEGPWKRQKSVGMQLHAYVHAVCKPALCCLRLGVYWKNEVGH